MKFKYKEKLDDQDLIEKVYDYVLDPAISKREREIGLLAKNDLEKGRYSIAVLNQIVASLQQEAVTSKGLSENASKFYHVMSELLVKTAPFGTNLGTMPFHQSYLY